MARYIGKGRIRIGGRDVDNVKMELRRAPLVRKAIDRLCGRRRPPKIDPVELRIEPGEAARIAENLRTFMRMMNCDHAFTVEERISVEGYSVEHCPKCGLRTDHFPEE